MPILIALLVGLVLWYIYYGIECWLNGGHIGRNQFLMHFPLFWEDLTKLCPSLLHFVWTHLVIPFGPAVVVWCFWKN